MNMSRRLYVLVRKDLPSKAYCAVQAGHAVAEFMKIDNCESWENETLIYLTVPNIDKLMSVYNSLTSQTALFVEPDLNDEPTAFATVEHNPVFDNLRLL